VKKVGKQGYSENKYVSTFVGMAPADNPQLVMAITIHEPGGEHYYGGAVAAPVFSKVMAGALRLLDIAPDDLPEKQATFAMLGGTQ
jgi:cell division protein FtsI (penicillin-binding protein 3)